MQEKYKTLTFKVSGIIHSKRNVVVLLHKQHFSSRHSTSFNSISIITKPMCATTKSNIMAYVKNSFTFKKSRKTRPVAFSVFVMPLVSWMYCVCF